MRFKRLGALLLSAVTICVGLIAGGAASPASAAQKSPVAIGVICSCTGPLGSSILVGPPAYQAWADYQNTHGGLNGHPIKVIIKDDVANPTTALSDVTSFVTNDQSPYWSTTRMPTPRSPVTSTPNTSRS